MTLNTKSPKVFLGIALVVFVFDQWSKWWAVGALTDTFKKNDAVAVMDFSEKISRFWSYKHPTTIDRISVLDNFWHYTYAENPGAAWSFLADADPAFRDPFFTLVSILAMVFIVVYFRKSTPEQHIQRIALSMIFGGAIGNFFDRIRLSYVIDFIQWHWYNKASWPIFNIADACISVGVVLLLLEMAFVKQPKPVTNKV